MTRRWLILCWAICAVWGATPKAQATRYLVRWRPDAPASARAQARPLPRPLLARLGLELVESAPPAWEVEWAEEDTLLPPAQLYPDDPLYPQQWALARIGAPEAWAWTTGDPALIAAVVDTGAVLTNRDLAPLLLSGYNVIDQSADTRDDVGHGTACASVLGAIGNNGFGMVGVVWTSRLLPVKVTMRSDGYAYWSDLLAGVTWAVDHGARVVSVSYSLTGTAAGHTAAQYAYYRGAVLVVAAGNDYAALSYPDDPYMLTVGASDQSDLRCSYSNTGPFLDLVAPGRDLWAATWYDGFRSFSGTSASTPLVAGVAALVFSLRPDLSAKDVEDVLCQSADDLGPAGRDDTFGWGRVDAARALSLATGWTATTTRPTDPPPNRGRGRKPR